jgi:flavin reductase (DIM6/NTAB) family NADH-FMN oxidoreductase RutF
MRERGREGIALDLDLARLPVRDRYKLLTALVVPRPIALVTSRGPEGVVNAAPYSFFNVFSQEPALVVLGIEHRAPRAQKDTARNIAETRQFVVNLVDEDLAAAMNVCAIDFPPEESEIAAAGLTTAASRTVDVPRLAEAPAALECRLFVSLHPGHGRELVVGEITGIHVRDGILDPATLRIDWGRYRVVGRLFGNLYCRTRDTFELVRRSYAEWRAGG